jgi:hypothetical protein
VFIWKKEIGDHLASIMVRDDCLGKLFSVEVNV